MDETNKAAPAIELFEPLHKAWHRTKWIVFRPFSAGKWCILAFPAWLAFIWTQIDPGSRILRNLALAFGNAKQAQALIRDHLAAVVIVLALALLLVIGLVLVLVWAGSRAHFVFLDQTVKNHALIAKPWQAYKKEALSLFFWRVGFGLASLLIKGAIGGLTLWLVWPAIEQRAFDAPFWTKVAAGCAVFFIAGVVLKFIQLLVDHFIVPLMHKHRMGILETWQGFRPWLRKYLSCFVAYALLAFVVYVNVMAIATLIGILTFGYGLALLGLPYIGILILLPFYVFFRLLGPEFLAQFSGDLDVFMARPEVD